MSTAFTGVSGKLQYRKKRESGTRFRPTFFTAIGIVRVREMCVPPDSADLPGHAQNQSAARTWKTLASLAGFPLPGVDLAMI